MVRRSIVARAFLGLLTFPLASHAAVFINEVVINPPGGSGDDFYEFIELQGTPGMKLDGYAIAVISGYETKTYVDETVPPRPNGITPFLETESAPEIDEFFSLDGRSLGANGLLVVGIGAQGNYLGAQFGADASNYAGPWSGIWNGLLDTPGKLQNDGSTTIVLIRNRPGRTQADPANPAGLRWGKDILCDDELIEDVFDNVEMEIRDQWGDGDLDDGLPNNHGIGGPNTLDLRGKSTLMDSTDDLEVVDEISFEGGRGWEYDSDSRHVDMDSTVFGLPHRHVHALDDPQGFNPDALTRVDYRTKGDGWTPSAGATGEMTNGNNWQDTATEQWIRGDMVQPGAPPNFFYSNIANPNPDAIQPYQTNVPLWLNDGTGTDYNFLSPNTYQIYAGRTNTFAVPFIPGDTDRDGDADADDIAKILPVFGDDDWVFSNSFALAPEGDGGDPAEQTRPWDLDGNGDHGIDPCDLQWALNFQGNTTGRIVGVRYDGPTPTPSGSGVHLNDGAGVTVTLTTSVTAPPGRTATSLEIGDVATLTVLAHVSGGGNLTAEQENGVMQYIHDLAISTGGVLQVQSVTPVAPFADSRESLEVLQGNNGDRGVDRINGHTTSFTQGLGAPSAMYQVSLLAVDIFAVNVTIAPSDDAKFAATAPAGIIVGHTKACGQPATVVPPAPTAFCVNGLFGDVRLPRNGIVNLDDILCVLSGFASFSICPNGDIGGCSHNGVINLDDILAVLGAFSGSSPCECPG